MEEWRPIADFPGYEVSNQGRVKSFKRGKEEILQPSFDRNRYLSVRISVDNKLYTKRVHRLVCAAFLPNPENKPQVDHINHIRHDNCIENLRWATKSENQLNRNFVPGHSGHLNIHQTQNNYRVQLQRQNKLYQKTFKTLEEAIAYRDSVLTPTTV